MTENITYLNCKELNCPMPIIKLTKRMAELASGEKIRIDAADPAFHLDLEIWAKKHGHTIIEFTEDDNGTQSAIIRKK